MVAVNSAFQERSVCSSAAIVSTQSLFFYSVSKSPEDSILSEHHPKFLVILQSRLLRFIITAFMINLFLYVSVIANSCVCVNSLVTVVFLMIKYHYFWHLMDSKTFKTKV